MTPKNVLRRVDPSKKTSLEVFREFLQILPDGTCDASRIHSKECYEAWLTTRRSSTLDPEKTFQRSLSAHLTAVDGRVPFSNVEEEAILKILREATVWPCFAGSSKQTGSTGFRAFGYHEKQKNRRHAELVDNSSSKKLHLSTERTKFDAEDAVVENVALSSETTAIVPQPQLLFSQPAFNLFGLLKQWLTLHGVSSTELQQVALHIARFIVIGVGVTDKPSQEDARDLMNQLHQMFSDRAYFVQDLTESVFDDRFMLQDELSQQCFGRITKADGGAKSYTILGRGAHLGCLASLERALKGRGKTASFLKCNLNFLGNQRPIETDLWHYCSENGSLLGYAIRVPDEVQQALLSRGLLPKRNSRINV